MVQYVDHRESETLRQSRNHREYHQLVQELYLDDGWFKAYFRMSWGQSRVQSAVNRQA